MPTTSPAAIVEHDLLMQSHGSEDAIPIGSPAWYAWLASSTSFTFRGAHGTFTAHKEHRSPTQEYWKAYRRRGGRLYRAYLGKSYELTPDRLTAVASQLAGEISDPALSPSKGSILEDTSAIIDARSLHLLATKLALPPSRIRLVPRPRLVAQFETAIAQEQRLLLVAAPAGFGKTTAITEWLHSAGNRAVAWLALDDADNQLNLFLAYLIAALETLHPRIGSEAWALLRTQPARPPTQAILTSLMNALAKSVGQIILTLDDYHTITLPAIHEAITFLLDRIPPHFHIIITTRADPPLPLARLRARRQLTEVRAADLRFTRDEAAYLFEQVYHIALSPDAITTLETRTEGWATGLNLAALSLQEQDAAHISTFLAEFSGSHTYVFGYLAEEVFQKQPDHVHRFLLQTTILERLCGPLCAAVTGQDDAQAVLEQLSQANLFLVPMDTNRRWYRYHPLFRDFLREHLERGSEAAARVRLYRLASAWFEQGGLAGEAIDYALQAEAWHDALRCLTPLTASARLYEYYLDWPRWVAALPDGVLQDVPDLCLRLAWILTFTGHAESANRPLNLAEAVWQSAGNLPKLGEVLCWRAVALFYRRDMSRAIQVGQQALVLLSAEALEVHAIASLIVGYSYIESGHVAAAMRPLALAYERLQHSSDLFYSFSAAFGLARAYQHQGHLRRAAALYQNMIQRSGSALHQSGPAPYIYLGMLFYEWNDLPAAERTLREGIDVGQRTGRGRYWPRAYTTLAQVLGAHGDIAQAHVMIEQALAVSKVLDSPHDIAEVQAQQAWLWLAQGDVPAVARWLTSHVYLMYDEPTVEHLPEYLMLVRIRITQELQERGSVDLDAIVRLLGQLLQTAEADQRLPDQIVILALLALAHAAGRELYQALESLTAALALAEPEGCIRTFVGEGASMRSLLIAKRGHVSTSDADKHQLAYIERLLDAFPQDVAAARSTGVQLLSEREHTVLQLLAAGRSIQEIAELLIISSNTVRAHVKHIYAKLDVHNRVQALERARGLQLL